MTTVYLRRLEGQADTGWAKVAEAIAGKTVRKIVVVPGRLVNIVV